NAQAANAHREFARLQAVRAENPLAVAQAQLDQAETTATSARSQRQAAAHQTAMAKAAIDAARAQATGARTRTHVLSAQVQQAQLSFGYARIVAPVDGYVAQQKAAIGTYVSPGQQILAIVPLDMWVTANFKETQLTNLRRGQPVKIDVDACPDAEV